MLKILITGAGGYIGRCLFEYLKEEYQVFGLDKISSKNKNIKKINLLNESHLNNYLKKIKPDLVVHLAGKSTIDDIKQKNHYINDNVKATKILVRSMKKNNISNIIFSSTAAVYLETSNIISVRSKILPNNIYGKTKLRCEKILNNAGLNYVIFRFFNVCSSITKLRVGENHKPETHLIPLLVEKALKKKIFKIYGDNYKTFDGTCIRDYIHIVDLCNAIKLSFNLFNKSKKLKKIFNLGTSKGYSVKQVLSEVSKILKIKIKFKISTKRKGDLAKLVCSYTETNKYLKWMPRNSILNKMIKDEIIWQRKYKKTKLI
jgi:UDP-glucose 4-epimerase